MFRKTINSIAGNNANNALTAKPLGPGRAHTVLLWQACSCFRLCPAAGYWAAVIAKE